MAKKSTESAARLTTRRRAAGAASSPGAAADTAVNPTYEEIADAAYRRYLNRGGEHGRDFDDWLEAERELRERTSE